jgi:hypothetical protein
VSQAIQPEYTAESIFGITHPVVLPFVSELGYANIAMDTMVLHAILRRRERVAVTE